MLDSKPMKTLCKNLYETIVHNGDEWCASRFGIKQRTIKSYRLGERRPSLDVADQIIGKEGVDYDWVFKGMP